MSLDQLTALVARLRRDCPWDRRQTHASMRPYLMEELYEALEAIDRGDPDAMREELGDLLFQIVFHARIAEEEGRFTLDDVAAGITRKMIERHPHVFGTPDAPPEAHAGGPAAWEARKAAGRPGSRLDSVPAALPALLRAHKVGKKLAHLGFDWPDHRGVLDKLDEERRELEEAIASGDPEAIAAEYGDLLLTVTSLGRHLNPGNNPGPDNPGRTAGGVCAEDALRAANARFEARFRRLERLAAAEDLALESAGLERLEALYQQAKRQLREEAAPSSPPAEPPPLPDPAPLPSPEPA